MSALQAMAANPDHSDFMHTMDQHWPGLRTIALPRITIPNFLANSPRTIASIPNANPPSDQPGHPQYNDSERRRSSSCASTSSQKGGKEHRPASRKRNDRSPSTTIAPWT